MSAPTCLMPSAACTRAAAWRCAYAQFKWPAAAHCSRLSLRKSHLWYCVSNDGWDAGAVLTLSACSASAVVFLCRSNACSPSSSSPRCWYLSAMLLIRVRAATGRRGSAGDGAFTRRCDVVSLYSARLLRTNKLAAQCPTSVWAVCRHRCACARSCLCSQFTLCIALSSWVWPRVCTHRHLRASPGCTSPDICRGQHACTRMA